MKIQYDHSTQTVIKNFVARYLVLIDEYELVKSKSHPNILKAGDFYKTHKLCSKTFLKYYKRYVESGRDLIRLMPQKRGPRYTTRRTPLGIEKKVVELRNQGNNRYEIYKILKDDLKYKQAPAPSTVYEIFKRYGVNKKTKVMNQNKRKIIKRKAGEQGHVDIHYLRKSIILSNNKQYYVLSVLDSASRIAWSEILEDTKAITVMFSLLRIINILRIRYSIEFSEILSDNGVEFKGTEKHPVEMLLKELQIKHICTKPYRPQTNGKIERFWRTLEEDFVEGTMLDSLEEVKSELEKYMLYYNELRPHQGIGGKTPKELLNLLPN